MKEKEIFEIAFQQANKAYIQGEIPVGAVIVKNNKIISTGYNKKETEKCSLYHAELIAIKKATEVLGNWRLNDCEIYVTLEPCEMCASAIKQSRIKSIYSALKNDDENIHNNVIQILKKDKSNPQVELFNNRYKEKGKEILKDFFNSKRNR